MNTPMNDLSIIKQQLAPTGVLRVALNMSNFLLVNCTDEKGDPDGISPCIARALADELGVASQLIEYTGPGLVADAAAHDEWDIANIAAEPARARVISFSPAYCEIQATYLLPPGSTIRCMNDVDKPGVRIAVKDRAAYDLWLTDNLKQASLQRADSHESTFELFVKNKLDALAGLRPKLVEQQHVMPGSVICEDSFTAVQQSIGCKPGNKEADIFLKDFVHRAIHTGLVDSLIDRFGVQGKLSVATMV